MPKIPVLEIFGPTIEGEGAVIGQKTMFVRTSGCDYRCSWCDSSFTWDGSAKDDIRLLEPEDIISELDQLAPNKYQHVTISGGNPALIKNIGPFVEALKARNIKTALETQGSKFQEWMTLIDDLTISPKPPSSGMKPNLTILDEVIAQCVEESLSLKVVGNPYLDDSVSNHTEKLLEKYEQLIDKVMNDTLNDIFVLPQLHTLLWSNKKGV